MGGGAPTQEVLGLKGVVLKHPLPQTGSQEYRQLHAAQFVSPKWRHFFQITALVTDMNQIHQT